MANYNSAYTGSQIDGAIEKVIATELGKYNGVAQVIKITDADTTLADIVEQLIEVNTDGNYVFFDTSALNANAYLCTISFDDFSNPSTYKMLDLVTTRVGNGFYSATMKLADALRAMVEIGEDTTVYGARWDKTSAQMSRYGKAAGITTTTTNFTNNGSANENYDNPFDSIYPWSGRKLCNIDLPTYMSLESGDSITDCVTAWEGDSGFSYNDPYGVWVYTPEFWGRAYDDDSYRYFEVSPNEQNGFVHYPESIKGKWVGGVVKSLTIGGASKECLLPTIGIPTGGSKSIGALHTCAKNWGATLDNRWTYDATALLYIVEFANYNVQSKLGSGVSDLYNESNTVTAVSGSTLTASATSPAYIANAIIDIGSKQGTISAVDGTSITVDFELEESDVGQAIKIHGMANYDDMMGSKSGYIGTNSKSHSYYRGEEFYGNMFTYILGIYRDGATNHVWVASSPEEADNYDALDKSVHLDTGITLAGTSGYVKSFGISSARNLFAVPCCTEIGGSSSAPVGDYHYVNETTASRLLVVGGDAYYGAACGFSGYWYVYSGNAFWDYVARPNLLIP